MVKICDYEGSLYRTDFWESQGREYEDLAERIALRKLLPPAGARLLDIGAGFGRLVDLYDGYRQVVLLDYSKSMLRQAQERLGRCGRYIYVVADLYGMPFVDSLFDTTVTVRVLHHVQNVPAAFQEIQRVLKPGGVYVLEYANKRHLKAILRYLLGRQSWSPFAPEPYELVELSYDFHPAWMKARLEEAGFAIGRELAVSSFRLPLLKRLISPRPLAALDGLLQGPTASLKLAPSVFLRARAEKEDAQAESRGFFRCPSCHKTDLIEAEDVLTCQGCGRRWAIDNGIYDFKEPAA
ncbi:MAG: class I SAM-dependent methyltransferase [Anaerolineae bacterium]